MRAAVSVDKSWPEIVRRRAGIGFGIFGFNIISGPHFEVRFSIYTLATYAPCVNGKHSTMLDVPNNTELKSQNSLTACAAFQLFFCPPKLLLGQFSVYFEQLLDGIIARELSPKNCTSTVRSCSFWPINLAGQCG